jgi:hypothetical protein
MAGVESFSNKHAWRMDGAIQNLNHGIDQRIALNEVV